MAAEKKVLYFPQFEEANVEMSYTTLSNVIGVCVLGLLY